MAATESDDMIAPVSGLATAGFGRRFLSRSATGRVLCRRLDEITAVNRAFAVGQEGFPGDAFGIENPALFGIGIAAGSLAFFNHWCTGGLQTRINFAQFGFVLDLYAEVINALVTATGRDREIDPRIVQHPLDVVRFEDGGFGVEQGIIESYRCVEISD